MNCLIERQAKGDRSLTFYRRKRRMLMFARNLKNEYSKIKAN
jgi:hypothetical protein